LLDQGCLEVFQCLIIPARILKQFAAEFVPHLTTIFNTSITKGEVPTDWRQANVIPIFKKGEKYLAINYRPVSLACICCKLLKHIVVSSILKHLDLHNILSSRLSTAGWYLVWSSGFCWIKVV
jgi:hypothetical protein